MNTPRGADRDPEMRARAVLSALLHNIRPTCAMQRCQVAQGRCLAASCTRRAVRVPSGRSHVEKSARRRGPPASRLPVSRDL